MNTIYLVYAVPMVLLWIWWLSRRRRVEQAARSARDEAHAAGLLDPASLHPVIDASRCIGCGSCVKACPEQPEHQVLGLIRGKAQLLHASDCIGHGACRTACPVDAITLVFGTERRGVDIPVLTPEFETNIPGMYVAGELGGMGLIRNALTQGREAVEAIHARRGRNPADLLDIVIVGAGPAGFSASLMALSKRMRYVTLEQEMLGGAVFQYPRGKLVMTAPAEIPLVGKVKFSQTSKEALLEFWKGVEKKTGVQVHYQERVERIDRDERGFIVRTTKAEYRAANVLLAIGRRGTPRKLGVPGEQLPKVVYRLIDPEQYRGQRVVVVGGGDSAIEAATSIAEQPGTQVILSYRSDAFGRAKGKNRERLAAAQKSGRVRLMLKSNVKRIEPAFVMIECEGNLERVENDAVIVSAGGILPTEFLQKIGIVVETKYGTA